MKEDLKQIPMRVKELREILEVPVSTIAKRLAVDEDTYCKYESGELDIPISALYEIASVLQVDFTVLLTGESPRMNTQCVVRSGKGVSVDRFKGYSYSSLAFNFIGRAMEPMLVTLSPEKTAPLVTHDGQEFNYVLSGKVKVTVGAREYILSAGDSIYFDPRLPHGQAAVEGQATFLTVINE